MTLVLLVAGTPAERANVAHFVSAGHVDGVLLISSHESDPLLGRPARERHPDRVLRHPARASGEVSTVSVDEVESARTMTRYLREQGHAASR